MTPISFLFPPPAHMYDTDKRSRVYICGRSRSNGVLLLLGVKNTLKRAKNTCNGAPSEAATLVSAATDF